LSESRVKDSGISDALRTCREKFASELEAIRTARASKAKVAGYLCQAFPASVAAGLGLRPLRLHCGASSRAEGEGEKFVRADVCPLVKSLLGNVSSKLGLHAEVDLWIGLLTCDQMRRALFSLSDEFGLEVHPIQLPATRTEESAAYYAGQVKRFVSDVETLHGLGFDSGEALSWHEASGAAADALITAARSMRFSPLLLHAMFHLYFICRPHGLAEFFEKVIASAPPFPGKGRIVVTGSPIAYEDTILLEALDEAGVSVLPLNCTGLNAVEPDETAVSPASTGDGLVERLALDAFYRAPCARARPNASMYERLKDNVKTSGAAGVIVKCLKFCDLWHTEHKRMAEELDVPLLVLDSVYAEGERERLRSRVEAFVETIT
jgi:benzoyl-CoA reductase/2-hydroxyglutaryl-CoA dehydratase subunit BcrC/BadD/HgdB